MMSTGQRGRGSKYTDDFKRKLVSESSLFDALQDHHMIRVSVDCLGQDSTSIKVHPDGTGALQKTARKRLGNLAANGTQKFI